MTSLLFSPKCPKSSLFPNWGLGIKSFRTTPPATRSPPKLQRRRHSSFTSKIKLEDDIFNLFRTTFDKLSSSGQVCISKYIDDLCIRGNLLELSLSPRKYERIIVELSKIKDRFPHKSEHITWSDFLSRLENETCLEFEKQRSKNSLSQSRTWYQSFLQSQGIETGIETPSNKSQNALFSRSFESTDISLNSRMMKMKLDQSNEREVCLKSSSTIDMNVTTRIKAKMTLADKQIADIPWVTDEEDEVKINLQRTLISARLTPLTTEDTRKVTTILRGPSNDQLLIEKFNIPMTREKILCLRPGTWLNDEIINFCMSMLEERDIQLCDLNPNRMKSHYFNSFFMEKLLGRGHMKYNYAEVARWTRRFDIFARDKIFIPINISNTHWTIAIVLIQLKEIHYYDSMRGEGGKYKTGLLQWVKDDAKAKKGIDLDTSDWKLISKRNCPQQQNGFDCGMFSIMCADFMTDDLPVLESTYGQTNMPHFRHKVLNDILRGSYTYPLEM